jgi:hypothetical protein
MLDCRSANSSGAAAKLALQLLPVYFIVESTWLWLVELIQASMVTSPSLAASCCVCQHLHSPLAAVLGYTLRVTGRRFLA